MSGFFKSIISLLGVRSEKALDVEDALASVFVPIALKSYFDVVSFTPTSTHVSGRPPILKMTQLMSATGPCQVVYREDTLLDMDLLSRYSTERLHRMDAGPYQALLIRLGVALTPPIPALTGHPTWVDSGVDALDWALIDLTGNREYMTVSRVQIQTWTQALPRKPLTMAMYRFDPHAGAVEEDIDRINASIRKLTSLRIKQRLADTLDLPLLPSGTSQLLELRSSAHAGVRDLVSIVENDPTLAANVMRWANSSTYAMGGHALTVHECINRVLGFDLVMNLAMSLALRSTMKIPDHKTTHVLGFWEQSMYVAHATSALVDILPTKHKVSKGMMYLCGLLHNFGYLVLSHTFPPHFKLITESTDINRHVDVSLVDAHILGITREQVGAELMQNWLLPESIVTGIRYQKMPEYVGRHHVFANLVYLARASLIQAGIKLGANMDLPETVFTQLGVSHAEVNAQIKRVILNEEKILSVARIL